MITKGQNFLPRRPEQRPPKLQARRLCDFYNKDGLAGIQWLEHFSRFDPYSGIAQTQLFVNAIVIMHKVVRCRSSYRVIFALIYMNEVAT